MKNIIYFLLIIPFLLSGCKKDKCNAGTGGSLTIVAKTMHHTHTVKGCTVYLKYCTKDFPGEDPASYDATYKIPNDTFEIAIPGLNDGDYYFYSTGIDSTLDPSNNIVKGGIPYTADQKEGTINIIIPITEGD